MRMSANEWSRLLFYSFSRFRDGCVVFLFCESCCRQQCVTNKTEMHFFFLFDSFAFVSNQYKLSISHCCFLSRVEQTVIANEMNTENNAFCASFLSKFCEDLRGSHAIRPLRQDIVVSKFMIGDWIRFNWTKLYASLERIRDEVSDSMVCTDFGFNVNEYCRFSRRILVRRALRLNVNTSNKGWFCIVSSIITSFPGIERIRRRCETQKKTN